MRVPHATSLTRWHTTPFHACPSNQEGRKHRPQKVRDAFMQIKGMKGATGLAKDVTPDGETVHELLLVMIENGRHKVIQKVRG